MTRLPRNHFLAAAIAKSGMSLTQISAAANISRPHLSRLLAWRSVPSYNTARRLAKVLDAPVDTLGLHTAPNAGVFPKGVRIAVPHHTEYRGDEVK